MVVRRFWEHRGGDVVEWVVDLPTVEEVDARVEGTVDYVLATGGRVVMDGQEVTR